MKHLDTRKTIKKLKRICAENGIDVIVVTRVGSGSHVGLIFKSRETGETVKLVFSGDRDISPGMQRNILRYVSEIVTVVSFAQLLHRILEKIFR